MNLGISRFALHRRSGGWPRQGVHIWLQNRFALPMSCTKRMRTSVLLIEDDDRFREIVAEILELHGYNVWQTRAGYEGCRAAHDRHPDVIVCDALLPDIHGLEVVSALRRDESTSQIPVVMMTGTQRPANHPVSGIVREWVQKPVTTVTILGCISAACGC